MNRLEDKIKEMVAEVVEISVDDVHEHACLVDDLGVDSLDYVEIMLRMEREFYVRIPDREALRLRTVQHLIDFIKRYAT